MFISTRCDSLADPARLQQWGGSWLMHCALKASGWWFVHCGLKASGWRLAHCGLKASGWWFMHCALKARHTALPTWWRPLGKDVFSHFSVLNLKPVDYPCTSLLQFVTEAHHSFFCSILTAVSYSIQWCAKWAILIQTAGHKMATSWPYFHNSQALIFFH